MKIAVVTCYKHNDYVRARTLRTAVAACPGVEAVVVRNRHRGLLRYPEVALRLIKTRLVDRPDAYVVTFRGYELLFWMRLTLVRKPIIFDELINFTEWLTEHDRITEGTRRYRRFQRWNAWLVRKCRFILADTAAHAEYSSKLNTLSINRYQVIPVCADETLFKPQLRQATPPQPFTVLYFGSMLPLHGLRYVLQAAERLKGLSDIEFKFIGGKSSVGEACRAAAAAGAHVQHEDWVPFEELPKLVAGAGLVLGGPFGDTLQSRFVVTGKTYQALATAAPVLVGKNEVHEGFIDKQNCLIVPQADAAALAEAISWAAEHPQELWAIGQAGRKLYDEQFSQATVNKLIQNLIGKL